MGNSLKYRYVIQRTLKPSIVEENNKKAISKGFDGFDEGLPKYIIPHEQMGCVYYDDSVSEFDLNFGWSSLEECVKGFRVFCTKYGYNKNYNYEIIKVSYLISSEVVSEYDEKAGYFINKKLESKDPHGIIGFEVPRADRSDYGLRIKGYDFQTEDYLVEEIVWSTGELLSRQITKEIDQFKITYRYVISEARAANSLFSKERSIFIKKVSPLFTGSIGDKRDYSSEIEQIVDGEIKNLKNSS
jgi:hypothetical protein